MSTDLALKDMLAAGELILVPNQSIALHLRRIWLDTRIDGLPGAANIQVLGSWLPSSIESRNNSAAGLASDTQLQVLWEQVLKPVQRRHPQMNPAQLAPTALTAWRRIKQWRISTSELRLHESSQLLKFADWVTEFERALTRVQLSTVELEIERQLSESNCPEPNQPNQSKSDDTERTSRLWLYGFIDSIPPLWQSWLNDQFTEVIDVNFTESRPAECRCFGLANFEQEIQAAARWAGEILRDAPQARIAIVDTTFADNQKAVKRVLSSELAADISYSFSLREPLLSQGPVQTALALLELNLPRISLANIRYLAQSPLWGNYLDEYPVRAAWDTQICQSQASQFSVGELCRILNGLAAPAAGIADSLARQFLDRRKQQTSGSPEFWSELFYQQLRALRVSLVLPQSNGDIQISEAWLDALHEFSQLTTVVTDIHAAEALRLLRICCNRIQNLPGGPHNGVRVLDTVESVAGYTHVWMSGMDQNQWPASTSLNPLIPAALQIQHQMPHSSAIQETRLAQALVHRVKHGANTAVFSYSLKRDDLPQQPSSLIADLEQSELSLDVDTPHHTSGPFEWVQCQVAPAVADHRRRVNGGSTLLKTMTQSPFNAFVQWRLGVFELPGPKIGLDQADRGILVHRVLDAVWNQLGDSRALARLADSSSWQLCRDFAIEALRHWQQRNHPLGDQFLQMEAERLARLVNAWLNVERQRPPFSIAGSEQSLNANLAGLEFTLRLDRLDQLDSGEQILIDYKTGAALSLNDWLGNPPTEPQLPLYALFLPRLPEAICYAQVRPDRLRYLGVGVIDLLPGINQLDDWNQISAEWQSSLETVAQDFLLGDCRVFETQSIFGQADPLVPLHRFAEFPQLNNRLNKSPDGAVPS